MQRCKPWEDVRWLYRRMYRSRRPSPLPPTKTFARALLGTVGPVTAEQLEQSPSLAPGDEIEDVQGAVSLLGLMMKFVDSQAGGSAPAEERP